MKKCFSYIVPAILCALVVTVIFVGYFKYEYKANLAHGIAAPTGVSLCFICFCCAELVCAYKNKYNAAIVLAIIKFILLFIGLITVFAHTLAGLGFMVIFGLAIPIFLPVAIAAVALRALFFAGLILFYIGIIAEPIILSLNRKPKEKAAENIA